MDASAGGAMFGCVFSHWPNLESELVIDDDADAEDESLLKSVRKDIERECRSKGGLFGTDIEADLDRPMGPGGGGVGIGIDSERFNSNEEFDDADAHSVLLWLLVCSI